MAGPPALSRRVFEKYDKDESGTIDRNEFKAMCYDLGYYLSEAETDIAFRTIDLSGNGDITYDEFYQAPPPHTPHTRDRTHRTRTHRTRLTMSVCVRPQFWRNDKRFENLHKSPAELQRLQAAVLRHHRIRGPWRRTVARARATVRSRRRDSGWHDLFPARWLPVPRRRVGRPASTRRTRCRQLPGRRGWAKRRRWSFDENS